MAVLLAADLAGQPARGARGVNYQLHGGPSDGHPIPAAVIDQLGRPEYVALEKDGREQVYRWSGVRYEFQPNPPPPEARRCEHAVQLDDLAARCRRLVREAVCWRVLAITVVLAVVLAGLSGALTLDIR